MKAALILLNDYRSGALGRISLESPQSREAMILKSGSAPGNPDSIVDDQAD